MVAFTSLVMVAVSTEEVGCCAVIDADANASNNPPLANPNKGKNILD